MTMDYDFHHCIQKLHIPLVMIHGHHCGRFLFVQSCQTYSEKIFYSPKKKIKNQQKQQKCHAHVIHVI